MNTATPPQPTITTPAGEALRIAAKMAELAKVGQWDDVQQLAAEVQRAVMKVPAANRRQVILDIQRTTERVAAEAADARQEVTGKLQDLRRGQAATEAYQGR